MTQNHGQVITFAGVSAIVGMFVAWMAITKFTLEPLENRVTVARETFIRALVERDKRMDYLQQQIDELEHQVRLGGPR